MPRSVSPAIDGVKPKALDMRLRANVGAPSRELTPERRLAGQVLEKILRAAEVSKKQFAIDLDQDEATVSRYFTGEGLPKLFVLLANSRRYRAGTVKGFARIPGDNMRLKSRIEFGDDDEEQVS